MHNTAQTTDDAVSSSTPLLKDTCHSHKGRLSTIVIFEVNKENLSSIWPYLLICIRQASFISLDLELSGLGKQKGWLSKSLEERYDIIRQSAQSRSVLAFGIATFQLLKRKETCKKKNLKYKCQVFNILTMCSVPFVVEPDVLRFLLKHQFDFNHWINLGISYENGTKNDTMEVLWHEILCAGIPITLHNGLIDLAFIYQHFYSALPETFTEFVANISDWFLLKEDIPGFYDSKYLAENVTQFNTSFLEYVFRKCQRENAIEQAQKRLYVSVDFDLLIAETHLKKAVKVVDCNLPVGFNPSASYPYPISEEQRKSLCKKFAAYELCRDKRCPFMHDVDILLSLEEHKQAKVRERRKRRYDYESKQEQVNKVEAGGEIDGTSISLNNGEMQDGTSKLAHSREVKFDTQTQISVNGAENVSIRQSFSGCHCAGVDSFITGFAAIFMQRMSVLRTGSFAKEHGNRIFLPGKLAPVLIHRSYYIKSSDSHVKKWKVIERERNQKMELSKSE